MRRCPIPMDKPVSGQLPSLVRDGAFTKRVLNLGWLLRNWKLVKDFDCYPHPPLSGASLPPELYLVARLRDGRTYETGFACLSVFHGFVDRPVFRGVPITHHHRLTKLVAAGKRKRQRS